MNMFDFLTFLIFTLKVQVVTSLSYDFFYDYEEGEERMEIVGSTTHVFINDKYMPCFTNLRGIDRKEFFLFYLRSFIFNSKDFINRGKKFLRNEEYARTCLERAYMDFEMNYDNPALDYHEYFVSSEEIQRALSKKGGKILNELFNRKLRRNVASIEVQKELFDKVR